MKTLTICALVILGAIISPSASAQGKPKVMTLSTSTSKIQGSVLWRTDVRTEQHGSTKSCKVGYIPNPNAGLVKRKFMPILSLPPLDNDTYEIVVVDDTLLVTTTKTGKVVVELNLENLVPALLVED